MNIFQEAANMLAVVAVACVVVLFAMMIDLASGLYKAKLRGEIRSSWGLKRTLTKFITYEGGMLIAAGVDLLMHMSRLVDLFGLDAIHGVPVVTCLVGIFLLVVEFISIREKADKKTKKELSDAVDVVTKLLSNENIKEILAKAFEQNNANAEQDGNNSEQ